MQFSVVLAGLATMASTVSAVQSVSVMESANIEAQVEASTGFKCPQTMSYCPWTKACACPPGQKWLASADKCVGDVIQGCWPKPDLEVYASVNVGVELAVFCAASPTKICRYDAKHEYCQAGLDTVAFVAAAEIDAEVSLLAHAEIDVEADISADLKAVVAGLSGLYLEKVEDAVKLFNTDEFGLNVHVLDVDVSAKVAGSGVVSLMRHLTCGLGLAKCNFDCVSFCTKGCHNYIDVGVDVEIGAGINHLVGLCILPSVIIMVNSVKAVVSIAVDSMLCVVGNLMTHLVGLFNCNCA